MRLVDDAWDGLRPHLVTTRFAEDAKFRTTYIYPEVACREALTNAIAHRDYSEEGRGIDIYVFDDRIEVHNPGGAFIIDVDSRNKGFTWGASISQFLHCPRIARDWSYA